MMSLYERLGRYSSAVVFVIGIVILMVFQSIQFLSACIYVMLVVGVISVGNGMINIVRDIVDAFRNVKTHSVSCTVLQSASDDKVE